MNHQALEKDRRGPDEESLVSPKQKPGKNKRTGKIKLHLRVPMQQCR